MGKSRTLVVQDDSWLSRVMSAARDMISQALPGGPVLVTLSRPTKSRLQECKFHAMIGDIAKTVKVDGKAYSSEVWKALLVDGFEQELLSQGECLAHPSKTVVTLDGMRAVTIRPSTTRFRKNEASQFIEYLYAFGTMSGAVFSEKSIQVYNEYREAQ